MAASRYNRALAEKRPILLASLIAALAFFYLRAGPWPELWLIPLKGASVLLLAIYALVRHKSQDGRLLAVLMTVAAFWAMADEVDLGAGQVLAFGYYLIALLLYLRHRRASLNPSRKWITLALLLLPAALLHVVMTGPYAGLIAAAYGLTAGAAAAAAWTSSFQLYRVGAGAVLVLLSDMLGFAAMGPLNGSDIPTIMVWPLAYLGQFLIAIGVVAVMNKREPQIRLVSSR
ncbi:lysoplasmalogenase [Altererythrobacter xixiisoli]|uniref:Lysoplasmalogenase n=1 Tax=Croceibacterium xixiisoli TaxID=1476466 RepID=A0A6I4TVH7_9SPHN|nr:lysoplasmalogenase family protein [Croceibacterium xixiisoli]MXO99964.1 lysoplasmalogenase [Croceibacterium xixiisoli]